MFLWINTKEMPLNDHELVLVLRGAASVAQWDAHPTSDHDVTDSVLARSGNILSLRLSMKYFLRSFSPFS